MTFIFKCKIYPEANTFITYRNKIGVQRKLLAVYFKDHELQKNINEKKKNL